METTLSAGGPTFDEEKFNALDRFLSQVKGSEDNVPFDDDALEDLQLSFLEHCDEILVDVIAKALKEGDIEGVHDDDLRDTLIAHVEAVPVDLDEREEWTSLPLLIETCMEVLEEVEDVSESWLLAAVFNMERFKTLYRSLEALREAQIDEHVEALRALFYDMMHDSPLLTPKSRTYFHLVAEHLNEMGIVLLMTRFLQAQLEYGQHLQDRYLSEHPELLKRVSTRFKREATMMAKRCTK